MNSQFIEQSDISLLYDKASISAIRRYHYELHDSHDDKVQRFLIAMCQDTEIPIHVHEYDTQWEMLIVLDGEVEYLEFDKDRNLTLNRVISSETGACFVTIYPNTFHTIKCLSKNSLVMEVKEGPYIAAKAKKII
ncbi:hypothetical protein AKJ18_04715 [Vibrio xuii]|nr:hypothetical protein AKJ18_04715 [Vibrio xuii]